MSIAARRAEAKQAAARGSWIRAAVLYSMLSKRALASEAAQNAADAAQIWDDQAQLAACYRSLDDAAYARRLLEEALVQVPREQRDVIRLELFKTLYSTAPTEALSLYQDLPQAQSHAADVQYLAGQAAFRAGRLAQAKTLLAQVPMSSDYAPYARLTLGDIAVQEKQVSVAVEIWQRLLDGVKGPSDETREALDLVRLRLANQWFQQSRWGELDKVLSEVPKRSRYYQQALLGRGLALTRKADVNRDNASYLLALVYLKRGRDENPSDYLGLQTSLLMAQGYQKVNSTPNASKALSEAIDHAVALEKDYAAIDQLSPDAATLRSALDIYTSEIDPLQKAALKKNTVVATLLSLPSSFEWLPKLSRYRTLKAFGERNLKGVQALLPRLKRRGFDPFYLQASSDPNAYELLPESILKQHYHGTELLRAHDQVKKRLARLEMSRRYVDLLMEEHRWQNISEFLVKNSMTEKLQRAQAIKSRDEQVRGYYLSAQEYSESPAVDQLKERIRLTEQSMFLEDRFLSQANVLEQTLNHHDARLKRIEAMKPEDVDPKIVPKIKSLRRDVERRRAQLKDLARVLEYYRAGVRWKKNVETVYGYLENPEAHAVSEEIVKVREFLEKIRREDEQAREGFLASIRNLQYRTARAYAEIVRIALVEVLQDLMTQEKDKLARLAVLQGRLFGDYKRALSADLAGGRKQLAQVQAALRFEMAKVLDAQAFKSSQ